MIADSVIHAQLAQTLDVTPWTKLAGRTLQRYDGKVRDCFIDRTSAASA